MKSEEWFAKKYCWVVLIFFLSKSSIAQKQWDGEGGDGYWETALNWSDNTIPSSTDDVVLDNSIIFSSFTVTVNGSIGTIQCKSLRILPGGLNKIILTIPSSNLNGIAFSTTGSGYTIELNAGAELVNASGASSGVILGISDSMKINNGAKYIHRTPRGNATILNSLSSAPGTESGIVEFDVKVASGSYIVSLTNRIFGNLVFSSAHNGGPIGYVSNGSNPVIIRGDLTIKPQVSVSVGFDDTIKLRGNLFHEGNVFNLSNNGNPTVLNIQGNIKTASGSTITETNTAKPVILFTGNIFQQIEMNGLVTNEIIFKLRKQGNVKLNAPLLLPYILELRKGILQTDATNLLTLDINSEIQVDSALLDSSFINGPVRKLGLNARDHFLFPVGKGDKMRWIELKNAVGDFTIEFFKLTPYSVSSVMNGIDHISSIEYWTVQSSGAAAAGVELSFDNVNSGGVTDMSTLRVAQLQDGWSNQGNTGTTGSAGGSGSVISVPISIFTQQTKYFTLASTVFNQNPLPAKWIKLKIDPSQQQLIFKWNIPANWHPIQFTFEGSADGIQFEQRRNLPVVENLQSYSYAIPYKIENSNWYRVSALESDGKRFYSNPVLAPRLNADLTISILNTMHPAELNLWINCKQTECLELYIYNSIGLAIMKQKILLQKGGQQLSLRFASKSKGVYFLVGFTGTSKTNVIRFYKN